MPTENERQELAKKSDLLTKQDTLIPGTGISIAPDGKTISATGTGGSTVEVTPIQVTGTRIAAMTVDGNIISLYAPTPPTVSATQVVQSGVELAQININGVNTSIYAPEGTVVLSGTSAPSSQQGSDGDLYVQYDSTTGDVIMTYVKLDGAWVELSAGGSEVEPNPQGATTATLSSIGINGTNYEINGLPENYDAQPIFLKITSPDAYNELGWGPGDDTWYYETSCTVQNNYRDYVRPSTSPALGGLVKNTSTNEVTPIFVSTDSTAVTVNSWASTSTIASFEYNGHTWYFNGGYYGCWNTVTNPQNIEYIGEFTSWQASAEWLVEHSVIYFDEYEDTFTQISAPASGYLFAGGGSQANLSDATFKVTSEGVVDAHEYLVDGQPLEAGAVDDVEVNGVSVVDANKIAQIKSYKELTQAQYDALTTAEKNNGTLYCITDASANGNLEDLGNVNISNPSDGDVVKWNATNQEWTAGEGGGTGDVADVYVNGTSVLDGNKIAQITNYVEVTQAEYDALPASKLTDNILYCIKDKATADTTVAPVIYSTDEREVGVWTNGKPLYQKTYYLATASHNTYTLEQDFAADLINQNGQWTDSGGYRRPIPWCYTNSDIFAYSYNNQLFIQFSPSNATNVAITVQYTKTTDTPGSGKWAPSGVPAVHYSENEQVIGTWIDGSPIYQKTLHFTNLSGNVSNWTILTKFEGIDNMISMTGHAINISTLQQISLNSRYISITYLNEYIQYYCESITPWTINIYLTIQYTKSTS